MKHNNVCVAPINEAFRVYIFQSYSIHNKIISFLSLNNKNASIMGIPNKKPTAVNCILYIVQNGPVVFQICNSMTKKSGI